ncbi:hypothetical protein GMES_0848 [Paraglaciecola mesophila KMM 241]|uniref:Uncharacterized protein n=1 Tax=Paraglaciecola mesophila KMM 241 TaxID=1128912 RepID=K6Z2D1_9ALTE|nr:hypothetical protein GMES_0848 [Paraglaciecola mesophila KMM 241]
MSAKNSHVRRVFSALYTQINRAIKGCNNTEILLSPIRHIAVIKMPRLAPILAQILNEID